jgi:hypothetical protein
MDIIGGPVDGRPVEGGPVDGEPVDIIGGPMDGGPEGVLDSPPKQNVRDVSAFYGYDKSSDKHAIQYVGQDTIVWVSESELAYTDLGGWKQKWFEISKKQGYPSTTKSTKKFRALKGGVLTRSMETTATRIGTTSIPVHMQSPGELCCLRDSYINLCHHLGVRAPPLEELDKLSEPKMADKISRGGYPCRLIKSK